MKIILLGAPGSGKGTQAQEIVKEYGLPHISTGDIFRYNIKNQTPLGVKVKEIIDAGHLCPDDLTIALVKDRLSKEDCENGYLLDGFPRNLTQATALDEFSAPDTVIDIDVDLSLIERRVTGRRSCIKCGGTFHIDNIGDTKICPLCNGELITRKDDTPETVKDRLTVYENQTKPLEEYYGKQGKLKKVNGNLSVSEVFSEIEKVLDDNR